VLGKLRYGASSTVWLVRDLEYTSESSPAFRVVAQLQQVTPYAALKVYTQSRTRMNRARDIPTLEHSQQVMLVDSSTILDSFEVSGPRGNHCCLVHEPLWMSLFALQNRFPGSKLTEELLRGVLTYLFLALDYLHTECHVIQPVCVL
jgi:hypothetical protein